MNDAERENWVDNDEDLYSMWRSGRKSKREFIRANRAIIDTATANVTTGQQPAHYLKYGRQQRLVTD
jgi:hypothetical protein